jgi:hypothetical protein
MARKSKASTYGLSVLGSLCGVLSLAVLASASVIAYRVFLLQRTNYHLRLAIPKVCQELLSQRELFVRGIEEYKRKFGTYPPDHLISSEPLVVDAITNQLLYELLGTLQDPAAGTFAPVRFPAVKREMIKSFFNTAEFRNSALKEEDVKHFIDVADISATVAVHNKPDVALLGYFPGWEGIEPDIYGQVNLSSWQYNSSAPRHNPGRYDLWIEVKTSQTNIVVGNW